MAKLKLRPWEYEKDEKMRLYWLCSPFKNDKGRWTIKAVFVPDSPEIFDSGVTGLLFDKAVKPDYYVSEFPWGVLPNLRAGRIYIDGVMENISPVTVSGSVFIPNFQNGSICDAFDIPIKLYDFFKNKQFGQEKIWRFQVDDKIYFLPCIEIIRAFFASSKTFTNQLLKPNGLDTLLSPESYEEDVLTVILSPEIPHSIVKDELVTHLLWLYYDEVARNSWESVYNNLFTDAIRRFSGNPVKMLSEGLPLKTKPPLAGNCHLHFTGTIFDKYCLIHEILSIDGFPEIEFDKVNYSHATFRGKGKSEKTGKREKGFPVKDKRGFIQDSTRRRVKTETNQRVAEIAPTIFGFSKLPALKRRFIGSTIIPSEQEKITDKETHPFGRPFTKNEDETVSADESYIGGEIRPIEFAALQLEESKDYTGLSDFLKTIEQLAKLNPQLSFTRNVYNIPGNSLFCFREQNIKRNFAMAYVLKECAQPVYIIEVARHDEWAVSTLLIQFHPRIETQDKISKILLSTLKGMVENNGHWQVDVLEQSSDLRFIRIKHFRETSPQTRAVQITQKLWTLGLR